MQGKSKLPKGNLPKGKLPKGNLPTLGSLANGLGGAKKNPSLGKGLEALIPKRAEKRNFFECPIGRIHRTVDQPRRYFDEQALEELAESIRNTGLLQPIVVRQHGGDYQIIAGERRWRASQRAGLTTVPVVIKDVDVDSAFELALVENIQRQDLNPVEEAEAYQRLLDLRGYTQEEMAQQLGKSRSTIANTLRLLNLSEPVQQHIASGALSSGAARALLSLPTEEAQNQIAEAALEHEMTVRQLEAIARQVKGGSSVEEALEVALRKEEPAPGPQMNLLNPREKAREEEPTGSQDKTRRKALAKELHQVLGVKANIKNKGKGGTLELSFEDADTLNRLVALLLQEA